MNDTNAGTTEVLDLLFPRPWVIERHLGRLSGQQDLLERLLQLSREYEERRQSPLQAESANIAQVG